MKLTAKQLEQVKDLVDDLGWEHQRMSTSGQDSYEKLCKVLGGSLKAKHKILKKSHLLRWLFFTNHLPKYFFFCD